MIWQTIISFTDKNIPYRYKIATSKSPDQTGANHEDWYNVMISELDEYDNIKNKFDFIYNLKDERYEPANSGQPILLITEQMEELVREGKEKW